MRQKKLVFVAAVACVGYGSIPAANATGSEIRTVTIALSPENAAVAVDGHPRQHPNGLLELRGPLGSVFTVEAVANGGSVIERVAITDVGALPPRLLVPTASFVGGAPAQTILTPLPDALVADECAQRTWWDNSGVKHYKSQCLGLDAPSVAMPAPAPARKPSGAGSLTVVCVPKCDRILDNGVDVGPGHIFNRSLVTGTHTLTLSAPNGAKKSVVVDIAPDQTREIRITMDANQPKAMPDALTEPLGEGYLTLASYPWTKVSENGRSLCLTPCVKIPMSPGVHVLVLENDSMPVKESASVVIRSGEITVKRFAFK